MIAKTEIQGEKGEEKGEEEEEERRDDDFVGTYRRDPPSPA